MSLRTPMVWSDACLEHVPTAEIWLGVRIDGTELPERATVIRRGPGRSRRTGWSPQLPTTTSCCDACTTTGCWTSSSTGTTEWVAGGFLDDPGQDRIVPYVFPTRRRCSRGCPLRRPAGVHGRAGRYGYDTMTLVGPGTWARGPRRRRRRADRGRPRRRPASTGRRTRCAAPRATTSPATATAAPATSTTPRVAAQALRDAGHERVAVVDIDAHHGNGTQMLFYDRADVFYGSLHIDPGAGWFPHYIGLRRRARTWRRRRAPTATCRWPRRRRDAGWLDALAEIVRRRRAPSDPAPSSCRSAWTRQPTTRRARCASPPTATGPAGALIGALGVPTVAVQEGGYHLPTLGALVRATLEGLEAGGALDGRARSTGPTVGSTG